ncbi:MAG: hypothetical protein E7071_08445 [Bacteroidales bacterium]|nr:hypothetical protein [Bacteroidales bacterium]
MTVLIISIAVVFIGLWYSGLYYNCSYFKKERIKMFIQLKELLNRRCELLSILADGVERSDIKELCDSALSEADIDKRVQIENEISKVIKEFNSDNNIVMDETLCRVEGELKDVAKEFNLATENYNKSVSRGMIRVTAKIAELLPGETLYIF